MSLAQLYNQAIGFHQAGDLAAAERIYAQLLAVEPRNVPANHMLGLVRHQQGRHAEALDLIGKALQINPGNPVALSNYGNVLLALERPARR